MAACWPTTRLMMLQCCRIRPGISLGGIVNTGINIIRVNCRCLVSAANIPQRPKRPSGTFMIFSLEKRQQVIHENPHLKMPEIAKVVGKMWRELSEEEKESYRSQARQNMEYYMEEMETFKVNLTEEEVRLLEEHKQQTKNNKAKKKHRQELKKLHKPKRPLTAYSIFLQSKLKNAPGNVADKMAAVAKEWKEMSEEEKVPFYESATKFKLDYKAAIDDWEAKMEEQGNVSVIRKYKPQQDSEKDRKSYPKRLTTDEEEPPF